MLILLLILQSQIFSFKCLENVPQMQVLYYSSDPNIQWPPEKTSSSPGQMLGHMEQLGKFQPRDKVEVAYKKGFPSAGDFYKNFVERQRPVIFANAVDNSDFNFLKLANLNQSARAALSFTDISSFTKIEKQPESLWQFLNDKINKTYYMSEGLHKNLKAKTILPGCLQCKYLAEKLFVTTHTIIGHVYPLPTIQVISRSLQIIIYTIFIRITMTHSNARLRAQKRSL